MRGFNGKWLFVSAIVVALVQTIVLVAGIERRAAVLRDGQEIVLRSEPVDPRDLMRGDYVILSYDISQIPVNLIKGKPKHKSGVAPVYVIVQQGSDQLWHLIRATFEPVAKVEQGQVMLRGQVQTPIMAYNAMPVSIKYGIERFYVPEGKGRAIEEAQGQGKVEIVVSVGDSGAAQIKALRLDGKEVYSETLF